MDVSILESLFPIAWLTTTMGYCDDFNDSFLLPINYCEGKSTHDVTARSGNVRSRKIWLPSDLLDGLVEFIYKAFRSRGIFGHISFVCSLRFGQCLFMKANRFGRHLPRKDTPPRF